jgi:hypothetical protein
MTRRLMCLMLSILCHTRGYSSDDDANSGVSEKMMFSKIFSGVWLARKNYKMRKSEFGKCRHCWISASKFSRILAGLFWINGRIRSYSVGSQPFWPNPAGFVQISAVSARSGQSQWDSGQIQPASNHGQNLVNRHPGTLAGCHRIQVSAGFRQPDAIELWRRLDSDDQ